MTFRTVAFATSGNHIIESGSATSFEGYEMIHFDMILASTISASAAKMGKGFLPLFWTNVFNLLFATQAVGFAAIKNSIGICKAPLAHIIVISTSVLASPNSHIFRVLRKAFSMIRLAIFAASNEIWFAINFALTLCSKRTSGQHFLTVGTELLGLHVHTSILAKVYRKFSLINGESPAVDNPQQAIELTLCAAATTE